MTDTEVIARNVLEARRRARPRTHVDETDWFAEGDRETDTEPFPLDHTVPALRVDRRAGGRGPARAFARPSHVRLVACYVGATALGSALGYLLSLLV